MIGPRPRLLAVAGRIREDDIALVRERARIDEIVSQHVTLRSAGGGNYKGLCPFHDEKSPSFNVTPAKGAYYCFGCGAGGDVFTFLRELEGLQFTEAVERLADKVGVQLRYVDSPGNAPRRQPGQRARLVQAHQAAAQFYLEQLSASGDAVTGRQFLAERGFGREAAERFGVGFAPRGGEALVRHLRARGFSDDELVTGGLASRGSRGAYDRFRGRLLWPIRDLSGDVVGFGARRLFDDDRIEAKYLNTAESPIYSKSQVLYGIDLARREIARASQAVVVEGYTDVMACHEAGVTTAVATCGTSFGDEHARTLRRLLLDHDEFRGEVIFTFDGDEAGQRAAMRAFAGDQNFVSQTYVAVEPSGLDPCDLRLASGDAAVRELVARRVPLYRFVLGNVVSRFDLDRADQRVNAMREAAQLVASVRDRSKVDAFARELAGLIGLDVEEVRQEVRRIAGRRGGAGPAHAAQTPPDEAPRRPSAPDPRELRFADEREALKTVIAVPHLVEAVESAVDEDDFTHPWLREIWHAVSAEPRPLPGDSAWVSRVSERLRDDRVRSMFTSLAVEPLHVVGEPDESLLESQLARLEELTASRRISALKSRLQRTNPVEHLVEYNRMFGELVALEQHRRALRDRATASTLP
jgi:DNA primase